MKQLEQWQPDGIEESELHDLNSGSMFKINQEIITRNTALVVSTSSLTRSDSIKLSDVMIVCTFDVSIV